MLNKFNQIPKPKPKAVANVNPAVIRQIAAKLQQGLALHNAGQLDQARVIYEEILILNPMHFDALQLLGTIAAQTKQWNKALGLLTDALKINTTNASVYNNHGNVLKEFKRLDEALTSYDRAIEFKRDYAEAYLNRGTVLQELNRLDEALTSYDRAIEFKRDYVEAYCNRGIVLKKLKCLDEALTSYDRAIEFKRDYAEAYYNRGNVLKELKRLAEALTSYDLAIEFKRDYAEAYSNRGNVLKDFKHLEEALKSYDCAIEFKRDFCEAYSNRGITLQELKRLDEALTSYDRAIEFKRDYAEAHYNRGTVLQELKRLDEALTSYDRAIECKPDYTEAYYNRGNALQELKRLDKALTSYDRAIECKPDFAEAYLNRGTVLQELNRLDEALTSYGSAIEFKRDYAEAYYNRATVLHELKRLDEALTSYDRAINLKPDYEYLYGFKLHTKMFMCDWQNFEADIQSLSLQITQGQKSSPSFPLLALIDSLPVQRKTSEIWIKDKHPINTSLGSIPKSLRRNKIRIGYYSADFNEHPVSYLIAELFEIHDKNSFELIAFYSGLPNSSDIHKRVASAFDRFIDVRLQSDKDVALMSRDLGIDIAIDLTGLTQHSRVGIFSYRAAPIQLSYIGYLGTMGADYYDYLIADKKIIPLESQQYYKEKIVYLPSYQVNDSKREIADNTFTRVELNLSENRFVFCCFNSNYKITPPTFDGWMRILNAVPDSVMFLYAENKWAENNLKLEAEKRRVSQTRLVFGARISRSDYLARYRAADLFLDTLPYNAGTTASDALWAGLPVLTCMGESFASRVAASLLNAIELPELITTTQEEYEATAIELATNPIKLKAIRDKLERNSLTTALFDTPRFTKHIEAAYKEMYECYQADLPPDHIYMDLV